MTETSRVVVVGAGMGGLAAALDLQVRGHQVTVVERAREVGGKVRRVGVGGAVVDAGPTVLTMRQVFDDLFDDAGVRLDDMVPLRRLETLARHAWQDGSRLDLYADPERTVDAIGAFAGAADARGYRRFMDYARRIWECVEEPVLRSQRPTFATLVGRVGLTGGLRTLMTIDSRRSMAQALGDFFHDPRLRQLFGRYATYSGCSPLQTPATLNLIAHVEASGAWVAEGGMWRLAQAVAEVFERRGGTLRLGQGVDEVLVERGRATGVRLEGGERVDADAVVVNADVAALLAGRLGSAARRAVTADEVGERSLSATTWALLAPTAGAPLVHRNVFFARDPSRELAALFDERRAPADPTVLVCAQDRVGDEAWSGPERLLVMTAAPADGDRSPMSDEEIRQCEERAFDVLSRCGLTVGRTPEATVATAPRDFERLFPATGGALYGGLAHSWKATFDRAPSWSRIPGLYLAGGSVHPGAGVPMVAAGGRLCAERVAADLAEGARRARVAGGGWRRR